MNQLDIRNGPPDAARKPNCKRTYEDDVYSDDLIKSDTFVQAGDAAGAVLQRLREDLTWFRGHAVAVENIGVALRKGVLSEAKAMQLRERLFFADNVGDYQNTFCELVEQKRDAGRKQKRRGRQLYRGRP